MPGDEGGATELDGIAAGEALAAALDLELLPLEGGLFRRTFTGGGASAILFMLIGSDFSAMHRLHADEIEALALPQNDCFAAGVLFARTEGIVPAPEPTHALAATMAEALACKASGEEKVIVTALCGHGLLDLAAYESFLRGTMVDSGLSDEALARAMATVPVGVG